MSMHLPLHPSIAYFENSWVIITEGLWTVNNEANCKNPKKILSKTFQSYTWQTKRVSLCFPSSRHVSKSSVILMKVENFRFQTNDNSSRIHTCASALLRHQSSPSRESKPSLRSPIWNRIHVESVERLWGMWIRTQHLVTRLIEHIFWTGSANRMGDCGGRMSNFPNFPRWTLQTENDYQESLIVHCKWFTVFGSRPSLHQQIFQK